MPSGSISGGGPGSTTRESKAPWRRPSTGASRASVQRIRSVGYATPIRSHPARNLPRNQRGRALAREVDPVASGGDAEARGALPVLGAVEHHVAVAVLDDGGVEDSRRFEAGALRHQDRLASMKASPGAEGR